MIYALPKNKKAKVRNNKCSFMLKEKSFEEALIHVEIQIVFPLGVEANGVLIRRGREITTSIEGRHVCEY